jgi:FkbM family methyltransferase
MRKVFIDCGGHSGDTVKCFLKNKEDAQEYEIYSFEPAQAWRQRGKIISQRQKNVKFIPKAVWIEDGTIPLHLSPTGHGPGQTIMPGKTTGITKGKQVNVTCIDFSKWMLQQFSQKDYIILKMDIEGAEYDVLSKMHKDGSIAMVNEVYIEFHSKQFKHRSSVDDYKVIVLLESYGLKVHAMKEKTQLFPDDGYWSFKP